MDPKILRSKVRSRAASYHSKVGLHKPRKGSICEIRRGTGASLPDKSSQKEILIFDRGISESGEETGKGETREMCQGAQWVKGPERHRLVCKAYHVVRQE